MINPFEEINWQPETIDIKKFAKTVFIGFTAISVIFFIVNVFKMPVKASFIIPAYLFLSGIAIFITSLIMPTILRPLYFIWYFIAACIGIVISNVILLAFYYLFFSVIALGLRILTNRDPLQLKKALNKSSYWVDIKKKKTLKNYLKQY